MELVGLQMDIAWEDREANCRKASEMLDAARPAPGSVVALPEMFASGFSMNVGRIGETESGPTERFLSESARRLGIYLIGGVAVSRGDGKPATNDAVVMDPDGRLTARYSKIHPYSPGKEKEHFAGGRKVVTFDTDAGRIAPFVCYDLRFPEIFRCGVQRGANVMVVIANWPTPRVEHWVALLRARAIENQSYVLGVNRCGNDPFLAYPGRSLVVDFRGNVLADAGAGEGMVRAEADISALARHRRELPFLGDMKRDLSALFD